MKNQEKIRGKGSLIVNADDFGLSPHINRGIIECIRQGAVNSISLVANGSALDEAVDFCKSNPKVYAGIHFTLIDELPVSDPARIPSLIARDGHLHPDYRKFISQYVSGRISPAEIEIELRAQVEKLAGMGITLAHADSHQHMHLLKHISGIAIALCREYFIPRIRIVNEPVDSAYMKQALPLLVMKYFSRRIRKKAKAAGIYTTEKFFGFNTSMHVTQQMIEKAVAASETFFTELMCHPGVNVEQPGRYGKWGMDWDRERNTIISGLKGRFQVTG